VSAGEGLLDDRAAEELRAAEDQHAHGAKYSRGVKRA
jgi:hypothetical protein